MRSTLKLLGVLLPSAAALAQAPAPQRAPVLPPRYEVEILVFAHRDFDPTEERFDYAPTGFGPAAGGVLREAPVFDATTLAPPLEPLPDEPLPAEPLAPLEALPAEPPAIDPLAEALKTRVLAPEELKLTAEYRRLRALSAYTPLVHTGWVQPGLSEAEATPFDLKTLGIVNPRGTVRVHLSRFLHITLDLTYQAPTGVAPGAALGADGLQEIAFAPQFKLAATRSARSGELHYFDHPAFGVLVRVTPVPETGSSGRPAA